MARLLVFTLGFFAVVLIFMVLALMGKHQEDKKKAFEQFNAPIRRIKLR